MHRFILATLVAGVVLAGLVCVTTADARDVIRLRVPSQELRAGNGVPVRNMLRRAVIWDHAHAPYVFGGGHSAIARPGQGVDCSGFVSAVVGLRSPMVSGSFMRWGKPGRGRNVTVLANGGHVLMTIRQGRRWRWFATSYSNPGGGAGEIARPSDSYRGAFVKRHPG